MEIRVGDARAYDFVVANDLYTFFKFESPDSVCEIGIAYDEYINGGDWYVNDGALGGQDDDVVDDIVWYRLHKAPEFAELLASVDAAIRKFNLG